MAVDKEELRLRLREQTAGLLPDEAARWDRQIFENLISLPEYKTARQVFLYNSVGNEVSTQLLIGHIMKSGKKMSFPLCEPSGKMKAVQVEEPDSLKTIFFGIAQPDSDQEATDPEDLDLVIVPALAFDREGYRLGQGCGYYDRYLSLVRCPTAGLCRSDFFCETLPRENHDIPVSIVVTEKKIARLR